MFRDIDLTCVISLLACCFSLSLYVLIGSRKYLGKLLISCRCPSLEKALISLLPHFLQHIQGIVPRHSTGKLHGWSFGHQATSSLFLLFYTLPWLLGFYILYLLFQSWYLYSDDLYMDLYVPEISSVWHLSLF